MCLNAPKAPLDAANNYTNTQNDCQHTKPERLPPRRQDNDIYGFRDVVPYAIVIGCFDRKGILSGIQIGIGRQSLKTGGRPVFVENSGT